MQGLAIEVYDWPKVSGHYIDKHNSNVFYSTRRWKSNPLLFLNNIQTEQLGNITSMPTVCPRAAGTPLDCDKPEDSRSRVHVLDV